MPRRKKRKVVRRKRKQPLDIPLQGDGLGRWLKKTFSKKNLRKANNFLRKNKIISKTAGVLDEFGVPHASRVARVSKNLGYGRRKPNKKSTLHIKV